MTVSASTLRKLASLNLTPEQLSGVVDILADIEQADEDRKAKQRDRKRRQRGTVTGQSRDKSGTVTGQVADPTPPKEISNPPTSEKTEPNGSAKKPTPRGELETVLDAQRAEAVIEHRQRMRKPLTPRAAHLLAGKFGRCRDPNAAADEMIANGWQGFEPDWLDNRKGNGNGRAQFDDIANAAAGAFGVDPRGQPDQGQGGYGVVIDLPDDAWKSGHQRGSG